MIKTIIIDDEALARQRIRNLLVDHPEVDIIGECKSGLEAILMIETQEPDLIFLDIQMKDINGFEVLERINPERLPLTIFVTAYDQYAIKAFEFFAFDYLLKPFKDARFEKSLNKALSTLQNRTNLSKDKTIQALLEYLKKGQIPSLSASLPSKTLAIKLAGKVHFIEIEAIQYIEASGYYIEIFCSEKKHLLRESLTNILAKLPSDNFIRIHRSTIINTRFLSQLESNGSGDIEVKMKNDQRFRVSKSYKEELLKKLGI